VEKFPLDGRISVSAWERENSKREQKQPNKGVLGKISVRITTGGFQTKEKRKSPSTLCQRRDTFGEKTFSGKKGKASERKEGGWPGKCGLEKADQKGIPTKGTSDKGKREFECKEASAGKGGALLEEGFPMGGRF